MNEIQTKYDQSVKGQARMQRENERRRNKTKFKQVMKQIVSVSALLDALSQSRTKVCIKYGKRLRFLE